MFDKGQHHLNSSLREMIVEHLFIGEALRILWRSGIVDVEILRSEIDAYGYDLVISSGQLVRHVQLKSGTKLKRVSISRDLAVKPSGCLIFIQVDNNSNHGPYFTFSGNAGSSLPDVSTFKTTKRTTANSQGEKPQRLNHVDVPLSAFNKFESLSALLTSLLGRPLAADPINSDLVVNAVKVLPVLRTDAEAEEFVETANLTEYDLSGFKPEKFKFEE